MVRLFFTVGSHQGVMVRLFLTLGSHQGVMVRLFLTVGSHQGVMVRLFSIVGSHQGHTKVMVSNGWIVPHSHKGVTVRVTPKVMVMVEMVRLFLPGHTVPHFRVTPRCNG